MRRHYEQDHDTPKVSIWRPAIRRARVHHKCSICKAAISPGQRYEYVFAVVDGQQEQYRNCRECLAIQQRPFPA